MKTLSLDEEFTLLFPLKTDDASNVLRELREHHYECSAKANGDLHHTMLSVRLQDFAHAQICIGLILSIVTDHNDILEYIKELRD